MSAQRTSENDAILAAIVQGSDDAIFSKTLDGSSQLILKLLQHRIGVTHVCQWQNFILREVVHGRSGKKHIKFFVGLYAIDPSTTMTAHDVVTALDLSFGLQF